MATYRPMPVLEKLHAAQGRSLIQRCHLMTEVLSTTSTKELKSALPFILHEIFDFEKDSSQGWQLDRIFRSYSTDLFNHIRQLLSPEGPLMKVINCLQADPYALYEFPLKYIPARNQSWSDLYEFIYPTIIDDMLVYFLPCDKSSLPSVPHFGNPHISRPPLGQGLPPPTHFGHSFPGGNSPMSVGGSHHHHHHHRSLFKASFISAQKQHQQSMPVFDQAEAEIWRSETFLQVITEFWLNQNSFSGNDVLPMSGGFQENFMPSMNHVKLVRLLVKYLHHFANSSSSVITSPFQQTVQSPLDQFKRLVIPHILQKKLYTFLRNVFDRWPLDSCFRMVLETWLSYIQPWRYTDFRTRTQLEAQHSDVDLSKTVDDRWDNFVEDNLLFYTVLTSEFIPRVFRMDLTSPYSTYMVYRVSRILNLPNLVNLILKAEQELCGGACMAAHHSDLGGSYLSGSFLPHLALPTQMMDMEGPGFQYEPFYGDTMLFNMQRVVAQLSTALETVRQQQHTTNLSRARADKSQGFFASLFSGGSDGNFSPFSSSDYKRLPAHLEQAIHNFCNVFSISKPTTVSEPGQQLNSSVGEDSRFLSEPESPYPECINTTSGLKLTDAGRWQLLNRERRFEEFDAGDPDLQPVRSYENTTIVRLLFHFCAFINSYYEAEFTDLYYRQTFLGRFARVYLQPPLSSHQQRRQVGSPNSKYSAQLARPHQPRVSLRFLASYRTLVHFALAYLLAFMMLGWGPVSFTLLVLSCVAVYGLVLASVRTFSGEPAAHEHDL
ncbi:sphingomyelin phosphodiesterase 4 [Elysia marginata]|uniref:Sphingomyelin phosphodiesterase 4 n=1 Tax=Elysia marginata TaxID=1093978 RepID=A0AAV4J082_9GAST|nr:sphingomyelin phosphodiesterase 4 [Elysia marginata]